MDFAGNPTDGTPIRYRVTGEGPAVVLVHGSALSGAIWRGFGYLSTLADTFTVITLDLRGHGRSGKPRVETAYRMPLFVGDVAGVLDQLGIERASYVGYSLGARVGFSFAATHPERVERFVSVAGAPRTERGAFDRVFFPDAVGALKRGGMPGFLAEWEQHIGGSIDSSTRAALSMNDPMALAAYMRAAERDRGLENAALRDVTAPTLLVVGSADPERLRAAEHAASIMPNARLTVLEGATHGDVLGHPLALRTVSEFLRG